MLANVPRRKEAALWIFGIQTTSRISAGYHPNASVAMTIINAFKTVPGMTALSKSQIGKISETLLASQFMLASGGQLAPFLSLADDDGVDIILFDKVSTVAP